MVRIRKHASSILSDQPATATATARATQAKCELNLSPWDLIPFNPRFEFAYQLKIEDEFMCNSAGKELVFSPQRSLACLKKEVEEYRYKEEEEHDIKSLSMLGLVMKKKEKKKPIEKKKKKKNDDNYVRCVKTDGKTWQCKKEAQRGEELCEHHLVQLKSYQNRYSQSTRKPKVKAKAAAVKTQAGTKRNRGRVETKPADFYYYSGFGPSWGKKRRGGDEVMKESSRVVDDDESSSSSSSSLSTDQYHEQDQDVQISTENAPRHDDERVFYDDEDEEENEEEGDVGKTRVRKPIKERSLNSLF